MPDVRRAPGTDGAVLPRPPRGRYRRHGLNHRPAGDPRRRPERLWQHPPEAAAERYVRLIGGVDATVARAQEFADAGALRFAAEPVSHAVLAGSSHAGATTLLADVFTRLGHGSECGTWRNNFLSRGSGARWPARWHVTDSGETFRMELSTGVLTHHPTTRTQPADLVVTLTRAELLEMLGGAVPDGVQFDGGPKTFATIVGLTDEPAPFFAIVTP